MIQRARRPRPAPSKPDHVRVACYCRVSVAERGETQFSSIDAQREALTSYVASQQGLGWRAVDERYEDEGHSGGTVERPALQRLLADARAGRIDAVAVYKFDRLSRRQIDFLRTVEELDELGVKFISITQSLDTSTSMGRCMLNVMSAFAQLEREVIAERTRDKMGAARRKGMWTGGRPILGYDVVGKKLEINEQEAEVVRRVFELYLQMGGLVSTVHELRLLGVSNKRWTTKSGEVQGGSLFEKNSLGITLRNVLYIGCVRAGEVVVAGEHEAIVPREQWDAVQRQLSAQGPDVGARATKRSAALLSGILRCRCGSAMTPTTAKGRGRTYSYYACARAVKQGRAACPGSRVAAGVIESFVIEEVRKIGRDPAVLDAAIATDREERDAERAKLAAEVGELRVGRGRHVGDRDRLIAAIGEGKAPASVMARVEELDGFVAEADGRIASLERDLAALEGQSDVEALKAALLEFDSVWTALEIAERARVLALVLDEVVVDGASGNATLTFRGAR
jgi:site-specific DNA recombinase